MREVDPLWEFAVRMYERPGVRDACLRLQDTHGADVDVLLACLFAAQRGIVLARPQLESMRHAVADVDDWTRRARALRREAAGRANDDPHWQPLAAAMQAAELAGEAYELSSLYGRLGEKSSPGTTAADAARASLATYAEILGISGPVGDLRTLVGALDTETP